jgi:hypothetical protein
MFKGEGLCDSVPDSVPFRSWNFRLLGDRNDWLKPAFAGELCGVAQSSAEWGRLSL